mmetsp:Transcript_34952/g.92057  ORF Transcript_34952/g.92057 Transcript_34952/m.92057 type:complete len:130 (+) Transcript_34952:2-391(+)
MAHITDKFFVEELLKLGGKKEAEEWVASEETARACRRRQSVCVLSRSSSASSTTSSDEGNSIRVDFTSRRSSCVGMLQTSPTIVRSPSGSAEACHSRSCSPPLPLLPKCELMGLLFTDAAHMVLDHLEG